MNTAFTLLRNAFVMSADPFTLLIAYRPLTTFVNIMTFSNHNDQLSVNIMTPLC